MIEESAKLIQPRDHKAKVCIWKDLTVADMDRLDNAANNADKVRQLLCEIMHLEDPNMNPKHAVLLDLYFYTLRYARQQEFSKEQTSAYFSIVKNTHAVCTETPFGNVQQCFNYFRETLLCHAVKRPPFSTDLFTPIQVKNIMEHIINTYFRHYKLYKYVFTPLVRLDLSMSYAGMPPTPEPSEEDLASAAATADEDDGAEKQDESEKTEDDTDGQTDGQPEKEESPAASELRKLLKQHLSEELKNLKTSVDDQLKESEQSMNKLLASAEGSGGGKGRSSAKSKKNLK